MWKRKYEMYKNKIQLRWRFTSEEEEEEEEARIA